MTENEAGDGGGAGLGQRRRALQKSLDLILQATQSHRRGNQPVCSVLGSARRLFSHGFYASPLQSWQIIDCELFEGKIHF